MTAFCADNSLQTWCDCCTKMPHHFFIQIGPGCGQNGSLSRDATVRHLRDILFKDEPCGEVHRIQVWAGRRPHHGACETTFWLWKMSIKVVYIFWYSLTCWFRICKLKNLSSSCFHKNRHLLILLISIYGKLLIFYFKKMSTNFVCMSC